MLECRDIRLRHGAREVLDGVSLVLPGTTLTAVLGRNGAGKTALLQAIAGIARPVDGEIRFEGERIDRLPAHAVIGRGIVQVPAGGMVLAKMTVRENLLLGAHNARSLARARARLDAALIAFPLLAARLQEPALALAAGERRMLSLARGLMAAPRLMLLDEPSAGLAGREAAELFRMIGALPRAGIGALLVEQNVRQALAIAEYGHVMEAGRIVHHGPAKALAEDPALADLAIGRRPDRGDQLA